MALKPGIWDPKPWTTDLKVRNLKSLIIIGGMRWRFSVLGFRDLGSLNPKP